MTKKKRILFVINSLDCGGAEKSLVSLISLIDTTKYEVYLQMFRKNGIFMNTLPDSVHILPEPNFNLFCKKSLKDQLRISEYKYLSSRIKLFFELRRNRNKMPLHSAQIYWKTCARAFDKDLMQYDVAVAWGQGNPTHYVAEKVTSEIKLAVINVNYEKAGHNKNFDKPYYEKYHYIVNVSDELCKLSKEVFPDFACKMVTIYDINNPDLIFKMSLAENPFEYETVPLKIVTVGRMTEQKGYDLAVGAAKLLKDRGIQFKWYFVGDGVCREEIEMLITKNELTDYVVLVGVQENPYVYMKNADIYVQTSRFEGYCLTLCEARMLNKPIVSTNFDVVYNQLKNEENGLIVEMNTDAIAEGIVRLWNDVDLKNHIISNLEKEKKGNVEEIEKIYALFLE